MQAANKQTSDIALYPALCCMMLALSTRATAVGFDIVVELGVDSCGGMVDSFVCRVQLYFCALVLCDQLVQLVRCLSERALSFDKITTSGFSLKLDRALKNEERKSSARLKLSVQRTRWSIREWVLTLTIKYLPTILTKLEC